MLNTAEKVHAVAQSNTHQDHANYNYLSNVAFMSKAELRKTMELMQKEINRILPKNNTLLNEAIELRRQRNKDLLEIRRLQDVIITMKQGQ